MPQDYTALGSLSVSKRTPPLLSFCTGIKRTIKKKIKKQPLPSCDWQWPVESTAAPWQVCFAAFVPPHVSEDGLCPVSAEGSLTKSNACVSGKREELHFASY